MKIYEKPELAYIDFTSEEITEIGTDPSGGLDNGGND